MASKPTKTVRHQKFLTEYTAKWDFIVPSVKGETYARCNSCNSDFSIKSSGAYDLSQTRTEARSTYRNAKRPLLSIISPCPKGTCSDEYIGKSLVTFKQFYVTHLFVKAILRLALLTLSKNMWIDWKCHNSKRCIDVSNPSHILPLILYLPYFCSLTVKLKYYAYWFSKHIQ